MADWDCACGCLWVRLVRVCGLSLQPIGCTVRPSVWQTVIWKLQLPLVALYKCYAFYLSSQLDANQLQWQSLQCSWTSSLELYLLLVTQLVSAPKLQCESPFECASKIPLLTYLLTYICCKSVEPSALQSDCRNESYNDNNNKTTIYKAQ